VYNYVTAAGEVGSGTPNAAGGRHFSPLSPKGHMQQNNGFLDGIPPRENGDSIVVVSFKPRSKDGLVDFKEEKLVTDIRFKLDQCKESIAVLHIVCGSKTGLVYPSLRTVDTLQREYQNRVVVVVDACQLRCRLTAVAKYTNM
jgi:hypothetical protein